MRRFVLTAGFGLVAACGLDVRGAPDDASTSDLVNDAGSEKGPERVVDAGVADGKPSLEFCPQDPDLSACFVMEGKLEDDSPRGTIALAAENLGFVPGRVGQAAHFTLTPKSNVRLPQAVFNTAHMTIEMWLRAESLPSGRAMLLDMNGRFGLRLTSDGTISCTAVAATTKVKVGTWMHVACVDDGKSMSTYVNGVAENIATGGLGQTGDWVGIGQDSPSGGDGFDGMIDELRIWSSARSATQVGAAAAR